MQNMKFKSWRESISYASQRFFAKNILELVVVTSIFKQDQSYFDPMLAKITS